MIDAIKKCVAGLDVHKKSVTCTILNEGKGGDLQKTAREFSTFRDDLNRLAKLLYDSEVELAVMESTGIYWQCVYEELEEMGIPSYVVNARHVKNVPGRKTDISDSEWLAELARCGLLRPSFIPPKDFREIRMLTRYRKKVTSMLGSEKNRIHKILESAGIKVGAVVSDIDGVSAREMVAAIINESHTPEEIAQMARGRLKSKKDDLIKSLKGRLSDRHRFLLKKIQNHMKWLENHINEIDSQVEKAMIPYKMEWQLLQTIPGVDKISAAMLLSEIGVDMSSFGNKDRLSSWAGMCPGNNQSANKRKSGRTRHGDKFIKSLLCEIANSARKTNGQYKALYQGLVIRRGHKRTIVAIGHKVLEVVFLLIKTKVPYQDSSVNYEEIVVKRNAPRWIKALIKYGYLNV
jgi:transposase